MICPLLMLTILWWDKKVQIILLPTIYQVRNLKKERRKIHIKIITGMCNNQTLELKIWASHQWYKYKINLTANKCHKWEEYQCKAPQMEATTRTNITNICFLKWILYLAIWSTSNKLPSLVQCNNILNSNLNLIRKWADPMVAQQWATSINSTNEISQRIQWLKINLS